MSVSRITSALAPRSSLLALALTVAALVIGAGTAGAQSDATGSGLWVAPERASHQTDPSTPMPETIKHGHLIFQRECELCHGKAGKGDGMQAGALHVKPANLASERVRSQSDGALFYKISEGRGEMPKAKVSDSEKWAVIEYIRTLPPVKEGVAAASRSKGSP